MFTIVTISHKTSDTRHPLILLTNREGNKYLFGKIPEGTQRVLNVNRVRLGKLKSIFLTGALSNWDQIGGLPGLFLTISDATKNNIDMFTNSLKASTYVLSTWRYFVFRKGVELKLHDTNSESIIADSNIVVRAIKVDSDLPKTKIDESYSNRAKTQLQKLVSLMFPLDTSKVNDPNPLSYKSDPSEADTQTHVKLPDINEIEPVNNQKSLSYLIRFTPMRGKFDAAMARNLGVEPGVDFRTLTQGEPVKNSSGELVYPEQVIENSREFPKVLILDIPNKHYLDNTIESDTIFRTSLELGQESIGLVYHFLGDDIDFNLKKYLEFISKFPPECKHVISHSKIAQDTLVFKATAINLLRLRCLQPESYSLSYIDCKENGTIEGDNCLPLQALQKFDVESFLVTYDDCSVSNDSWSKLYDENVKPLGLENVDKEFILSQDQQASVGEQLLKDQVQVITLGTGSALPSIHRNVISTLVRLPRVENGTKVFRSVMLDGGENTMGALLRVYGKGSEQLKQIFEELSMVYLSHLHADHHLGLVSVINKWFEVNQNPERTLYLVVPWQYKHFIDEWYSLEKQSSNFIDPSRLAFISCEDFLIRNRQAPFAQLSLDQFESCCDGNAKPSIAREQLVAKDTELIDNLYRELGIVSMTTVRAIHCYWSYSVTVDFKLDDDETLKVSYSGDTRPNPRFAEIGRGSDILIHESSLDNVLIEEALAKKHSTMIEALQVARLMNCRKVLLTHFSTRYSNKANMLLNYKELDREAKGLAEYLENYGISPNIFTGQGQELLRFDDLEVCIAFDMMSLYIGDFNKQFGIRGRILEILNAEDGESDKKQVKELQRQKEKSEAKRAQRLAIQKKRRWGSEEKHSGDE